MHRNLCTGGKRNEARDFDAGLGTERTLGRDEAAKIDLTYSTMSGMKASGVTLGTLVLCIIQVLDARRQLSAFAAPARAF